MTRAKHVLLPAICALAFTVGTPAMALNPQPLPPGYALNPQPLPPGFKQPTTFQAASSFTRKTVGLKTRR